MTARRWHRPSAFACVLTVVGVAAFIALGIWQIDRKAQKERLLAAFANAPSSVAQNFADVLDTTDASRYPHVQTTGRFLLDRGYLFDEQFHDGQPGIRMIAVFASDRVFR